MLSPDWSQSWFQIKTLVQIPLIKYYVTKALSLLFFPGGCTSLLMLFLEPQPPERTTKQSATCVIKRPRARSNRQHQSQTTLAPMESRHSIFLNRIWIKYNLLLACIIACLVSCTKCASRHHESQAAHKHTWCEQPIYNIAACNKTWTVTERLDTNLVIWWVYVVIGFIFLNTYITHIIHEWHADRRTSPSPWRAQEFYQTSVPTVQYNTLDGVLCVSKLLFFSIKHNISFRFWIHKHQTNQSNK